MEDLKELDTWRWSLQAAAVVFLTTSITYLDSEQSFFQGGMYLAPLSAVVVLESTRGGSLRKGFSRALGSLLGGVMGFAVVTVLSLGGSNRGAKYITYSFPVVCAIFAVPWGLCRHYMPAHQYIFSNGLATGIIILFSVSDAGSLHVAIVRVVAIATGVAATTVVVHLVFPAPARSRLHKGFTEVLSSLADVFSPLIELEVGLKTRALVPRFESEPIEPGKRESWRNAIFRIIGLGNDEPPVSNISFVGAFPDSGQPPVIMRNMTTHLQPHIGPRDTATMSPVQWSIIEEKLSQCDEKLFKQKTLLKDSETEVSCKAPHVFPAESYKQCLTSLNRLYHLAASLYYTTDMTLEDEDEDEDEWQFIQSAKVHGMHPKMEELISRGSNKQSIGRVARLITEALHTMSICVKEKTRMYRAVAAVEAVGIEMEEYKAGVEKRRRKLVDLLENSLEISKENYNLARDVLKYMYGVTSVPGRSQSFARPMGAEHRDNFWAAFFSTKDRVLAGYSLMITVYCELRECCRAFEEISQKPDKEYYFY